MCFDVYVCEILERNSFKGGECKTQEKLNFLKKSKMGIASIVPVENLEFF